MSAQTRTTYELLHCPSTSVVETRVLLVRVSSLTSCPSTKSKASIMVLFLLSTSGLSKEGACGTLLPFLRVTLLLTGAHAQLTLLRLTSSEQRSLCLQPILLGRAAGVSLMKLEGTLGELFLSSDLFLLILLWATSQPAPARLRGQSTQRPCRHRRNRQFA